MFESYVIPCVISDTLTSKVNSGTEFLVERMSTVCSHTATPNWNHKVISEEYEEVTGRKLCDDSGKLCTIQCESKY